MAKTPQEASLRTRAQSEAECTPKGYVKVEPRGSRDLMPAGLIKHIESLQMPPFPSHSVFIPNETNSLGMGQRSKC